MRLDDCFELGYIQKPHGLKGEVSVFLDTDFPHHYNELGSVFVLQDTGLVPFFIDWINIRDGRHVIVRFEDITTIDEARAMKGKKLYLPLEALPPLKGKQFYFHEIVGFQASDAEFGILGKVKTVYTAGAQDLVAVDFKGQEMLIPLTDEIISEINREENRILFNLPDGLIDIYLNDNED